MIRAALKFTDLPTFLSVVDGLGYKGDIKSLFYEQGRPARGSAYFVPTDLLPANFDVNQQTLDQFGGVLSSVEEIDSEEAADFSTDYMIFPFSNKGYVEIETTSTSVTFAPEAIQNPWTVGEMIYILNLEDGGGKEFYLGASGKFIALTDPGQEEPQHFKTFKAINKKMETLLPNYAANCRLYSMELREFEIRRKGMINPNS